MAVVYDLENVFFYWRYVCYFSQECRYTYYFKDINRSNSEVTEIDLLNIYFLNVV